MPAVDSILEAVQNKVIADPELNRLLNGGVYTGEVPATVEPPFSSLEFDSSDYEWKFEDTCVEKARWSVCWYSATAELSEEISQAFWDAFSWKTLSFKGDNHIQTFPFHRSLRSEPSRWKDGTLIFAGTMNFETWVERGNTPD